MFILLKISNHVSSSKNNWSILLPLHCYFTHFLKFLDSIYFGSIENDISSPCQQNQNIRCTCGSARRVQCILSLTWLSVSGNPNPTVSPRFFKAVEVLVTPAWCPMVHDICHQWGGKWFYSQPWLGREFTGFWVIQISMGLWAWIDQPGQIDLFQVGPGSMCFSKWW